MISIVATETSAVTFLSVPGNAYRGDFRSSSSRSATSSPGSWSRSSSCPSYFRKRDLHRLPGPREPVRRGDADGGVGPVPGHPDPRRSGLRLFLAAKVLEQHHRLGPAASIVAIGGSTLVYTYLGGMKAVVWTDVIQFSVYIVGGRRRAGDPCSASPRRLGRDLARARPARPSSACSTSRST